MGTSVKTVVHWFQIVACNRFQQFDEQMNLQRAYRTMLPASYEIGQIRCPMALFYGTDDDLTDMNWLLRQLPSSCKTFAVDHYEHLDTIWAESAKEKIFPVVVELLASANEDSAVGR